MILKKIKPTTPSQRNLLKLDNFDLNHPFIKSKIKNIKKHSGRNNSGKITIYHKGGGHKKKYRKLNSKEKQNYIGIICSIEYDPYRNAKISAVYDVIKNQYFYIISPLNIKIGDIVNSGIYAEFKLGHTLLLNKIPVGSFIYSIYSNKNVNKSQYTKSAGSYSQIINKKKNYSIIKLTSGKIKLISNYSIATIGIVSNNFFFLTTLGKAGRSRWLNKRPTVRGVAMNPIDHPHGGGEGKTSGGKMSVSPWGKPTKNGKTKKFKNK